jgi:hypothetical protein
MPDEVRLYGREGHRGFLLGMFREIHEHAREVGAPVESADDPMDLTIGFCVEGGGAKVLWKIPLPRLKDRHFCHGMNESAIEQVRELILKAEGRAQLAAMLTEGGYPGA